MLILKIVRFQDHEYHNLITFLERVNLTGREVIHFNQIMNALNMALDKLENDEKDKEDKK